MSRKREGRQNPKPPP